MDNVLSRKVSANGVGRSPISNTDHLGEVFLRQLETSLMPILKVSVAGMVLETEVTRYSSVAEGIPVPALLGVLHFEGAETSLLVNMSADLVFHVVDLLMGGDPETCPTPTTRSFTAIDYALMNRVLEAIGDSLGRAVSILLDGALRTRFELVDIQQNITNTSVANDNADVLVINSSLDIGDAARGGDFDLIVPLSVLDIVRSSVEKAVRHSDANVKDIWRDRMRRAAREADVPINAVLHRASFKAQFLEDLEVGQVLPIPSNAPQNVAVVIKAAGNEETKIATAKLGAYEGQKVIKLTTSPLGGLVSYLSNATGQD